MTECVIVSGVARNLRQGVRNVVRFDPGRRFLCTGVNGLEIGYKKLCIFLTGVYTWLRNRVRKLCIFLTGVHTHLTHLVCLYTTGYT